MSDETRIAVVGYGLAGRRHVETIRMLPEISLAAVVEIDDAARSKAQEIGAPTFRTIQELFENTEPDGVVLATPTPVHVENGLTCMRQGCPVLVEKPLAVTAADALELTIEANKRNVPILVGHHRRYNGVACSAKQAIENGAIGDIRSVQATCWLYKPDHYFYEAPWRSKKGAGPISVNLIHDVDLLRHFCGEVASVQAMAVPSRRGFENEDVACALLRFRSDAVATVSVSDSVASPWSWELTARENPVYPATTESCYLIGGSTGSLSIPDLRVWKHEKSLDWWTPIGATSLMSHHDDPLVAQMSHFARVICGQEAPLVSGQEGLSSLRVVEAIQEAADTEQTVFLEEPESLPKPEASKAFSSGS